MKVKNIKLIKKIKIMGKIQISCICIWCREKGDDAICATNTHLIDEHMILDFMF